MENTMNVLKEALQNKINTRLGNNDIQITNETIIGLKKAFAECFKMKLDNTTCGYFLTWACSQILV